MGHDARTINSCLEQVRMLQAEENRVRVAFSMGPQKALYPPVKKEEEPTCCGGVPLRNGRCPVCGDRL